MRRLLLGCAVAVVFFGAGWLAAGTSLKPQSVFRLSIDAPTGNTTIKCEGCQFLTWTADGHAGERQQALTFACSNGPCWKVVGAIAVKPEPKLIAQASAK